MPVHLDGRMPSSPYRGRDANLDDVKHLVPSLEFMSGFDVHELD